MEGNFITPSPDGTRNALEELRDSKLADPNEKSVVDARCQNQLRSNLTKVYLVGCKVRAVDIVGAVHKNDMN